MKSDLERLTLVDLTNLAVEAQDTPMHQGAVGVLDGEQLLDSDGRVRIDRIRAHLEGRLAGAGSMLSLRQPVRGSREWHIPAAYKTCLVGGYQVFRQPVS